MLIISFKQVIGADDIESIHFPPCDDGLLQGPDAARTRKMTNDLLANMARGLIVECIHGDIYATRLCKSVPIIYTVKPLKSGHPEQGPTPE